MGKASEFVAVIMMDTTLDGLPATLSNEKFIFKPFFSKAVMDGKPTKREEHVVLDILVINNNNDDDDDDDDDDDKLLSFVSRCGHVWYELQRFDCILLVFIERWGQLVSGVLIKQDASLWLAGFPQLR